MYGHPEKGYQPYFKPEGISEPKALCFCVYSDSWRCAVDRGLTTVSCRCSCHTVNSSRTCPAVAGNPPAAARFFLDVSPELKGLDPAFADRRLDPVIQDQQGVSGLFGKAIAHSSNSISLRGKK